MKINISSLCWTLAVAGAPLLLSAPAQAQNSISPGVGNRLSVVELRDTTLADALELIFQAAGNPSHIIDEQAQMVPIPATTLNNIAWDAAVRNLTQLNGYKVSRNPSGTYIIEPRVIAPVDGSFPGGEGGEFGGPGSPFPGGAPSNPFSRGRSGGRTGGNSPRTMSNRSVRANAQTRPNFGGNRTGGTDPSKEGKDYKIVIVRHIYAGGVAQLFTNSSVIRTEDFVSPGDSSGNSNGGGGGGQNRGGGGGGGQGGFGGGTSGFGGGGGGGQSGFGGGTSGFGGGGGGQGGGGGFGGGLGF